MVAAAATAAMAAQSHLQLNQPPQQQERGFLSWFPAANAVDNNLTAVTTAPLFVTPDPNMIAVATMPLAQPFPHPHFLNPCSTAPNTCLDPAPLSPMERKKRVGAGDYGFADPARAAAGLPTTTAGGGGLLTNQYLDPDIDALLLQHHATLRAGLQRSARRHCRDLVMAFARRARSRIKAVDAELEAASRRNAELEARVKQVSAESQAWLAVARDNEATVAALRSGLEQAMVGIDQTTPGLQLGRAAWGQPAAAAADDAQSCCFVGRDDVNVGSGDVGVRCRACTRNVDGKAVGSVASVVVLPCRHLCLCAECDRAAACTDACPVCGSAKTASIHVIFP